MNAGKLLNITQPIRVILVDDEVKACNNLKDILNNYIHNHRIQVVATANSTSEAELLIARESPDAIFLDIEMPYENAFQFLSRISPIDFEVIFVTAFDEYAIRALKLNALDYILKPISIAELQSSVDKLIIKTEQKKILNQHDDYSNLGSDYKAEKSSNYIKLKTAETCEIVFFKDILFVEAQGAYSKFYYHSQHEVKVILMCHTIADYEELLPFQFFFRVHRSFLVNHLHFKSVKLQDNSLRIFIGDYEIPVSRRRMNEFMDFYNNRNV